MTDNLKQHVTAFCSCGAHYALGPEYFGMIVECSVCGEDFEVPESDDSLYEEVDLLDYPCEHCGIVLEVPTAWIGQTFPCPSCEQDIVVPYPADAENDSVNEEPDSAEEEDALIEEDPAGEEDDIPEVSMPAEDAAPIKVVRAIPAVAAEPEEEAEIEAVPVARLMPTVAKAITDADTETAHPAEEDEDVEAPQGEDNMSPLGIPVEENEPVHDDPLKNLTLPPPAVRKRPVQETSKKKKGRQKEEPSRSSKPVVWIMLCILLILLAAGGYYGITYYMQLTGQDRPDSSLEAEAYAESGMPPLDRPWEAEDYRKASQVLSDVNQKELGRLPRYKSGRSGDLFQHMISPENLVFIYDESRDLTFRIEEGFVLEQALGQIVNHYRSTVESKPTYTEQIKLQLFGIEMHQRFIQMIDKEAQASFTRDPQLMTTSMQAKQGHREVQLEYFANLMNLAIRQEIPFNQRKQIITAFRELLPAVLPNAQPGEKERLKQNLQSVMGANEDDEMQILLQDLQTDFFS
jgi:uncharacterized Zn finger protein (UPF0148 family)